MSDLRRKDVANPSYSVLRSIIETFNVRSEWLIMGRGDVYNQEPANYNKHEIISKVEEYEQKVADTGSDPQELDLLLEYVQSHAEGIVNLLTKMRSQYKDYS